LISPYTALLGDTALTYHGRRKDLLAWLDHARHEGEVVTVWRDCALTLAIDGHGDVTLFCPPAPPMRHRYRRTDPPRVEVGEASAERLAYLAERARRRLPLFPRPGEEDPPPRPRAMPLTAFEARILDALDGVFLYGRQIAERIGQPFTKRFQYLLTAMRRRGLLAGEPHGSGYRKELP
jgi:hypothetical protein